METDVVCDLTLASKEHAFFKQTDPDVASFDSGYGSAYFARMVGNISAPAKIKLLDAIIKAEVQKRPDQDRPQ